VGSARRAGSGGSSGSRASRGRGRAGAGVRDRGGGTESGRESETEKDRDGERDRNAQGRQDRGRGKQGTGWEGDGNENRDPQGETEGDKRDPERQRPGGPKGEVVEEPVPAGRRGLGARGKRSGAGSGAQGGGQCEVTAREQWGRRREGACGGGWGHERHGSPDPRALSPGPGPDDADAEAAPRARRGAALKVGRPAGSGAGRPGDQETRGQTDRPTGSRGGGAGSRRVCGEGAPGLPSPRLGRRPPDCAVGCSARPPPPGDLSDPLSRGKPGLRSPLALSVRRFGRVRVCVSLGLATRAPPAHHRIRDRGSGCPARAQRGQATPPGGW
uniref:S-antigen protein-like n=1 Tax=Camelus bactrianus TaxID=9837 RepID=A0A9W3GD79_CAMBA